MIERPHARKQLAEALGRSPIVAILGPRQCGKTTLARLVAGDSETTWFDLEDPQAMRRLENPKLALSPLTGLVVIDEVQRQPELFPLLRVLADREPSPARFLILGSASPFLLRLTSESLAGRVEFIELGGFDLLEVGSAEQSRLWLRGGFPRSFLARNERDSSAWRDSFIATFLERDLPQLGIGVAAPTMRRFWTMLAHYHGQTWNGAELGRAFGVSAKTVRAYLDVLTATFVVRQVQPWFENLAKRQVKAPKVYLRDSGLLHALLGTNTRDELLSHPKVGASWEGFALEQVLRRESGDPYFWATHAGAEVDLVLMRRAQRCGYEFKFADAPRLTRSMTVALHDLALDQLWVVYPGDHSYPLAERITAVGLGQLASGATFGVAPAPPPAPERRGR